MKQVLRNTALTKQILLEQKIMLNLSTLKIAASEKLSLHDSILEEFINSAQESLVALDNDIEAMNPFEAVEALSVLGTTKDYFELETKWENLLFCCLKNIQKGIYNNFFHLFSAFSGITHIAFIVSKLSSIVPNLKRFSQSINILLEKNLSAYCDSVNKPEALSNKDYELITGLSGPLRYLLDFNETDGPFYSIALAVVDALIVRSHEKKVVGYIVPGWHYYPPIWEKKFSKADAPNGYIDYSVSHGMGGPLAVLSRAYQKGFRAKGLLDAIEGIISEYVNASYRINDIIYWPGKITFEQYAYQKDTHQIPGKMSWCYGSISILRVLYIASVSIANKEIEQFVIEELVKIAQMDLTMYYLSSPIVCHGFSGAAIIMKEMYNDTNNSAFLKRSIELAKSIVYDFSNRNNEANKIEINEKIRTYDYLEGYSGILQTICFLINDTLNGNEKRLLIV